MNPSISTSQVRNLEEVLPLLTWDSEGVEEEDSLSEEDVAEDAG